MKFRTKKWITAVCLSAVLLTALTVAQETPTPGFRVLHSFTGPPDGETLFSGVVFGAGGRLYGTTQRGGIAGVGTVFEVDRIGGTRSVLYSFTGGASDGAFPQGGVLRGADGTLYGTTYLGGTIDEGTIFKLEGTEETVLHSFAGGRDGRRPTGDLVSDAAGNLYGATLEGGTNGGGTVFRVDAKGVETVLYSFRGSDGTNPNGEMVLDGMGNLYGTTLKGGAFDSGTVFKLDPRGTLSVLYTFTGGTDGGYPDAGPVRDAAGNLYGTTLFGGDANCVCGTVFKVDTNGNETVLYAFRGEEDGALPVASLLRDAEGNLFGTASFGTVFELTEAGKLSILHSFNGNDGSGPYAGLIQDSEGNFYGTTEGGGPKCDGGGGCGVVYEVIPGHRGVSGTQIGHYTNGAVPVDLSGTTIAAFVPNGSGGYTASSGTGASDGTFTIPDVPSGPYLLQIGSTYLWTRNSNVNADFNRGFRSDTVQADQSTTVTFDLTHLKAWQTTDFLELVCPNNSAFDLFSGTVGKTNFTGTFPYVGTLSVGSEGDQYYLFQLITQNVGGFPFTGLGRYMAPAKFSQDQGSDTQLDGRLTSIPQNHYFEANINGADLAAQALAANPRALLFDTTLGLDVYPGSLAKGANSSTPDLVFYGYFSGQPPITTNADLGPVIYGNPFPLLWPLFDIYQWSAVTQYTAPGAANGAQIFSSVAGNNTELPTPTSPIKPLVGAVDSPSINHQDFFADRKGIGPTPTLRWSPPSVGTVNYYLVQVFELSNDAGNTVATRIADLRTSRTSLTIPQGVLSAGGAYVFKIRAFYIPGVDFEKTPFMNGATIARADVLSGMMQP